MGHQWATWDAGAPWDARGGLMRRVHSHPRARPLTFAVMPTHFMDHRFCVSFVLASNHNINYCTCARCSWRSLNLLLQKLCDVGRDLKCRKNPSVQDLAEAIGRVSWLDYDMSRCRYARPIIFMCTYKFQSYNFNFFCAGSYAMAAIRTVCAICA